MNLHKMISEQFNISNMDFNNDKNKKSKQLYVKACRKLLFELLSETFIELVERFTY